MVAVTVGDKHAADLRKLEIELPADLFQRQPGIQQDGRLPITDAITVSRGTTAKHFDVHRQNPGASSLIRRPNFPHGLPRQSVLDIIQGTYTDRPNMLKNFGDMIFHNYVTPSLSDWIFNLGLQASSWGTAAIANTWIEDVGLFEDMEKIQTPTLILHGLNDKVCLYPLAIAQKNAIRNSVLVPIESCGHFLFYDQMEKFNEEFLKFSED